MTEEQKQKLTLTLANNIINQLNLQGLLEAARFYSVSLAERQYIGMSDEDRVEALSAIEAAEEVAVPPVPPIAPVVVPDESEDS